MDRRRVLTVHAAGVMRMIIKDNLRTSGYEVVGEATNGQQAVEKYRELLPDVVTMDMVLPDVDGVATVRAITAEFPQAVIVVCSSVGEPGLVVEALKAGARSFIVKPFAPSKLIETIAGLMAN